MIKKHLIHPDRVRKVPKQFSWIDGRLIRDGYLDKCSHPAATLYLFLVTVSDARGLSYYSDTSVCKRLSMDNSILDQARMGLIKLNLIAYRPPLYQVLDLAPVKREAIIRRDGPEDAVQPLGRILKQIMEGRS